MIEIKAKLVADRISLARAGNRARRLPTVVLGTGAVIKLAPGRSVHVTPEVFEANAKLLAQFDGMLEFKGDTLPAYLQEARERGMDKARTLKAVEPEPAPVEPEPAPVEPEPAPKKKRKRRTKAEIASAKAAKND